MTKSSKTQLRAICPACFNRQALRNGCMVQHGYTRPDGWYANIGTCHGTDKAHFGTKEGREVTASISAGLKRNASEVRLQAARVRAGDATITVYGRERRAGKFVTVALPHPTSHDRDVYARHLDSEAASCLTAAEEYDARAAAWTPEEPIEVPMESKQPPVHFRATFYSRGGHKACASSAMGAMRGYAQLTDKTAEVTCERCKQRRAFAEALTKAE